MDQVLGEKISTTRSGSGNNTETTTRWQSSGTLTADSGVAARIRNGAAAVGAVQVIQTDSCHTVIFTPFRP